MDEISQNTTSGPSLDRAQRERDRAIIESYHEDFGVQEPSGVGLLASLLSLVTRIPTLDLFERVDADPDLQQELLDGYRAKSFEWIRQRGDLRPTKVPKLDQHLEPHAPWLRAASLSFSQNYVGRDHEVLLKTIDRYHGHPDPIYNRSMSIVQSSGCGKSRLVDKVAEIRFTFPLNLREAVWGAYPPADHGVRNYFTPEAEAADTDYTLSIKFASFLISLFDKTVPIVNRVQRDSHRDMASWWHGHLAQGRTDHNNGQNRTGFYDEVLSQAEKIYRKYTDKNVLWKLKTKLAKSIRNLADALHVDTNHQPTTGCFLLYIDEAHTLTVEPVPGDMRRYSAFHALGRVLSWITMEPLFTLFLSTNSSVIPLAPPTHAHPSAHAEWERTKAYPPYTELPFDTFSDGLGSELQKSHGIVTLDRACTLEVMIRYGRPMWYSQYLHRDDYRELIIFFAERKLSLGGVFADDKIAQLAALDVRVHLAFDMNWDDTRERLSRLVDAYLRLAYVVPTHREFMHSGYSSEPVVAEAAARLLNCTERDSVNPTSCAYIGVIGPDILIQADSSGYLARGKRAEAVGRLLMTVAHDSAIMSTNPNPKSTTTAVFHKPVKVLDFLRHLLHPRYHNEVLNARPVSGSAKSPSLNEAFQDAYISFSHFAQAGDSKVIQLHQLHHALLRGMAYRCTDLQTSIDVVTAIHFGDPSTTGIGKDNISILQVQINHRAGGEDPQGIRVDPIMQAPSSDLPMISLYLELGLSPSLVQAVTRRNMDSWRKAAKDDDHHYLIVTHGCSSETFSAIPPECDAKYRSLLRATSIMDDFPRNNQPGNLQLASLQKPAWYNQKEFFNWFE